MNNFLVYVCSMQYLEYTNTKKLDMDQQTGSK